MMTLTFEIDFLERSILSLKGKTTLREKEEQLRRDITTFANKNEHYYANTRKACLASILLRKDPPDYEEAICLLEEAVAVFERFLGPKHKEVVETKEKLVDALEAYKKWSASNDSSDDDRTLVLNEREMMKSEIDVMWILFHALCLCLVFVLPIYAFNNMF